MDMGMFDTVVIEGMKLPSLPREINLFLKQNNASLPSDLQTKDLENFLQTYTIDKNGQIFETVYKPTGKKKPYEPLSLSFKDNRSALEKAYHWFKFRKLNKNLPKFVEERVPVKKKSSITNTFVAGNYNEIAGRYLDVDYKFVAMNGKITKVQLVNASLESASKAAERKKQDAEFKLKMDASFEARRKFTSCWYYPILKEIYNPFVFFSKIAIQGVCNKILSLSHRWHGI